MPDNSNETALYHRVLARWGKDNQLRKLQEECGELIAAVNHALIGRDPDNIHLIEEIADVEILLEQVRTLFGDEIVNKAKRKKLNRLRERVDNPKK